MAQPVNLHADAYHLDQEVGWGIVGEGQFPIISDAQIAAASNTAGLKANVDSYVGHAETEGFKPGVKRVLDIGLADGSMSDANVQAATNATTLAANTFATPGKAWPLHI